MPKITFNQSELDLLFNEKVIVLDDSTRRVTKNDILEKASLPSNFEIEVVQDVVEEEEELVEKEFY